MIESAIYRGTIRHRRYSPKRREFAHSVCYFYLDLAEIPARFSVRGLFSDRGPSLFGFRRDAYLGPVELPLDEAVRRRVEAESGRRPLGPIRMLAQISYFGLTFNPVVFYYCFDESGEKITDIVTEITNTPWGERHTYVLTAGEAGPRSTTFEFAKRFHVSPFLGMDYRYRWSISAPLGRLGIHMENHATGSDSFTDEEATFDATLMLKRTGWSGFAVAGALLHQPFMTATTLFLIYLHAAVIWVRGIPFLDHPKSRGEEHPRGKATAIRALSEGKTL
jgi:DUF1365 family protein